MAKIKYSALVQEMRNKLNGSVLSKNRYGNYVRNKTTPVNPQTASQQNVRARLASVSQAWAAITQAARLAFASLAQNHPFTDIFGDQKTLDGKAMFSKLNLNLTSVGLPMLTNAPVFVGTPFLEITASTASVSSGLTITMSDEDVPVGHTLVVESTPALPATINFVKNRYRRLGTAALDEGVATLTSDFGATFGALSSGDVGKRVHYRAFLINNTTGQVSLASESSAIVGE